MSGFDRDEKRWGLSADGVGIWRSIWRMAGSKLGQESPGVALLLACWQGRVGDAIEADPALEIPVEGLRCSLFGPSTRV